MYAEVAWVLVPSGTQVQPQVIFDPDCLSDYLSVSYDYGRSYQDDYACPWWCHDVITLHKKWNCGFGHIY